MRRLGKTLSQQDPKLPQRLLQQVHVIANPRQLSTRVQKRAGEPTGWQNWSAREPRRTGRPHRDESTSLMSTISCIFLSRALAAYTSRRWLCWSDSALVAGVLASRASCLVSAVCFEASQ